MRREGEGEGEVAREGASKGVGEGGRYDLDLVR